jgi:hypothetical protein
MRVRPPQTPLPPCPRLRRHQLSPLPLRPSPEMDLRSVQAQKLELESELHLGVSQYWPYLHGSLSVRKGGHSRVLTRLCMATIPRTSERYPERTMKRRRCLGRIDHMRWTPMELEKPGGIYRGAQFACGVVGHTSMRLASHLLANLYKCN